MARKGQIRVGEGFAEAQNLLPPEWGIDSHLQDGRRGNRRSRLQGKNWHSSLQTSHPTNRHRCFSPNSPRDSHFDRVDKRTSHFDNYRHHAYRPVVKTCTFRVSRHAVHHHAVAKAERIHGVMGAYWNPRTHEMTVRYDARVTSARHIMHLVA